MPINFTERHVRSALPSEYAAIDALGKRALGMFGPHNVTAIFNLTVLQHAQAVNVLLHDEGNPIVGYSYTERYGTDLYLRQLFVDPDFNRRGAGGLLVQNVLRQASKLKLQSVSLITSKNAKWSLPFYERYGFGVPDENTLPKHIQDNLIKARTNPEIQSVPGYLPVVGMTQDLV